MAGGSLFGGAGVRGGWVDFRLGYQPAFDGLRGLGVTTFILYHSIIAFEGTNRSWFLPGAYLWLELFFVQSGFLITSLLLDEWHRTGEVRLRNFYARRALRLFPALFAVALFSAIALLTFSEYKGNSQAWSEILASLLYYQNWVGAFGINDFPYYMSHAWSLSIEEQFYLIAPVGILVLVTWQRSLRRAIPFLLVGALASAAWMGFMASHTFHKLHLQRLYYGTDTRAQALLIGVALAFAVHSGAWLRTDGHARVARIWGTIGVVLLVVLLFTADIRSEPMYYGFFLLCSTSVAGILSELVRHPDGRLARALSWTPLEMAGEMTYGLYLWHWPVILVINQYTGWPEFPTIALQVIVGFVVAAASYRWLERPLLLRYAPRFPRVTPEREAAHRDRHVAHERASSPPPPSTPVSEPQPEPVPAPPPAAMA